MKYKYTPSNGEYYQGLPAQDLDDTNLSDEQKLLLAAGVAKGIYKPVGDQTKAKQKNDDKAGA